MRFGEYTLETALTERGHTKEEIADMSPEAKFDEYCEWNGLIRWGQILRSIWKEANQPGPT